MRAAFACLTLVLLAAPAAPAQLTGPAAFDESARVFTGSDGDFIVPQAATISPSTVVFATDAWIGAGLSDLTDQSLKDLKLKSLNGVELTSVEPDGPAGKAGLKPRDVIVGFNGQNVFGVRELQRLFSETPAGRTVPVELVREGKTLTLSLQLAIRPALAGRAGAYTFTPSPQPVTSVGLNNVLAEATRRLDTDPDSAAALKVLTDQLREAQKKYDLILQTKGAQSPDTLTALADLKTNMDQLSKALSALPPEKGRQILLTTEPGVRANVATQGLTLEVVSGQLGAYFGLKEGQSGALVESVRADSAAAKAGLQAGDVVTAVNGKPLGASAAAEFASLARTHAGETMTLAVLRKGQPVSVALPAGTP